MGRVRVGEHVEIDGRDGLFVVLRLEPEREVADLLQIDGGRRIENDVPLASIRARHRGTVTETEPA